ncbi:DUF2244 domain-containing protein [Phyllobacterium myrsinacearum]|uniref:DUF2244 domain-containing protein n=1 Tax=Phyllobacterium myrsinacearum TaxID=28101 RepID=A0A2S9JIT6_9HYPH|nr:DUF2244 domain-containing protein [Phyllobacterium myrsinacearum]PRD53013.1 DUF2244 domain-containing protein [Phyllobacterium myrsinacearum]PWV94148.1 putative membrane protein [Phyllobacterium myrsinacearum]RZS82594.1 putative membrane protein [Phyllobacterium myrsinacearum]RZV07413.1 putative membrane protein [Phyllobacterium myrsinacearum]
MNPIDAAARNEEEIFRALLVPHRSLGRKGFLIVMAAIGGCSFLTGLFFLSLGAWPVFGFFGLDVLVVYLAFRMNYTAAKAHEEVSVSRIALQIRQVAPSGRTNLHEFNPFWTRFDVARHAEIGITSMRVEGQGKAVTIGSFLNPDDRESFALAFTRALAAAKGR